MILVKYLNTNHYPLPTFSFQLYLIFGLNKLE